MEVAASASVESSDVCILARLGKRERDEADITVTIESDDENKGAITPLPGGRRKEPRSYIDAPAVDASVGADMDPAATSLLSWALVCLCNMNRSMTAHDVLLQDGYTRVTSFGTADMVRLPSQRGPQAFTFGTRYSDMKRSLLTTEAQRVFMTTTGLAAMLDRNTLIKPWPQSWHAQSKEARESHDVVMCYDRTVYESVNRSYSEARSVRSRAVFVVLLHTPDHLQDAKVAAATTQRLARALGSSLWDAMCCHSADIASATAVDAFTTPLKLDARDTSSLSSSASSRSTDDALTLTACGEDAQAVESQGDAASTPCSASTLRSVTSFDSLCTEHTASLRAAAASEEAADISLCCLPAAAPPRPALAQVSSQPSEPTTMVSSDLPEAAYRACIRSCLSSFHRSDAAGGTLEYTMHGSAAAAHAW